MSELVGKPENRVSRTGARIMLVFQFPIQGTGNEEVMNQIAQPIRADANCSGIYVGYLPQTELCAGYTNGGKDFCNVSTLPV